MGQDRHPSVSGGHEECRIRPHRRFVLFTRLPRSVTVTANHHLRACTKTVLCCRPVLPSCAAVCAVCSLQNAPSLAHPSGRDVLCAVSSPSHQTDFCTSLCSQCLCARGDGCQAHKGHHCRVRPEVLCFHGTGASCCSWYFCCLCSGSSPLNTCNM